MTTCPCGSSQIFDDCCSPYINTGKRVPTAEALMRSRYTAYTLGDIDYISRTHDSSANEDFDRKGAKEWADKAEWLGLDIIRTEKGREGDSKGQVEFKAHYRLKGKDHVLHEISEFVHKKGIWYFLDGRMPDVKQYRREIPKVGRNDLCVCGSGKKYKKCCAKN